MDRYYMPVSREEDDSIDHQYKVYDYSSNDYQRQTTALPSKMKTKYWLGKQQLKQKLGKEQDEWVIKGDSSLDAKLSYFHHVNHSCNDLLRLGDRLQHHMKALSHQEMLLGKFLDTRSKHEGTEAGKMMSYIGYAEEYMSKKRTSMNPSITRLMQDLGVFQQKAVQDCSYTVNRMEQFRTEFRASLLWLEDISQQLNPEDREQLEKFRKVQSLTREKRLTFDKMKGDTIQKIDILAASRINLLSARLEEYHIASQKHFQSSINALKEVLSAKERLDVKIEEKRLADLEAEIDAHLPNNRGSKLQHKSRNSANTPPADGEDLLSTQKSTDSDSMKLKDLAASYNYSDDEDLVNLDEFGDFEKAEKVVKRADSEPEDLNEIFGGLSPAPSMTDLSTPQPPDCDLMSISPNTTDFTCPGPGDILGAPGDSGEGLRGGLVGGEDWMKDIAEPTEEGGEGESIDWTMMNNLMNEPDNDILSAPASEQDMMRLSEALMNLDTGMSDPLDPVPSGSAAPPLHTAPSEAPKAAPKAAHQPGQMPPQQFNAWLNLFSDLDPIAQAKSSPVVGEDRA